MGPGISFETPRFRLPVFKEAQARMGASPTLFSVKTETRPHSDDHDQTVESRNVHRNKHLLSIVSHGYSPGDRQENEANSHLTWLLAGRTSSTIRSGKKKTPKQTAGRKMAGQPVQTRFRGMGAHHRITGLQVEMPALLSQNGYFYPHVYCASCWPNCQYADSIRT